MKGWRTIVLFSLELIGLIFGWDQITKVVPPNVVAMVLSVQGIGLRLVTSTAVGEKANP